MQQKIWPLKKVIWVLLLSFSTTLTVGLYGFFFWKEKRTMRLVDPKYQMKAVVQTGPLKKALPTEYLLELLSISKKNPPSLYTVNVKEAVRTLETSPFIAKAKVKRWPPDTLYIDYETRRPFAILADYENIAIDREGYLFPITPFFPKENLVEIYLGLPAFGKGEDSFGRRGGAWDLALQDRYFPLACQILEFIHSSPRKESLEVKKIDVSKAFLPSLGQREVVLFTEETLTLEQNRETFCCTFPKILRLMPEDYTQPLFHFFALQKTMLEDYKKQILTVPKSGCFAPRIVDLRIPQLAFVENR